MPSGTNPRSHLNHRHKVYQELKKVYVSVPKPVFIAFNALIEQEGLKRSQFINQLIKQSFSSPFPKIKRGKDCSKFQIEMDESDLKVLDDFIEGKCTRSSYITSVLKNYVFESIDI